MASVQKRPRRNPRSGVTLIEMLAALAIFSLIGVAGFSLLDQSLRSRGVSEERLERLGDIERAIFLIKQDFLVASDAYLERDTDTGVDTIVLRPSMTVYSLRSGTLFRGDVAVGAVQALLSEVSSFVVSAFPSGRPVEEISSEEADEVWAESNGFQVFLGVDGVGTVEVVSPRVSPLAPLDDELALP